jgi:hypothetical protein
MASTLDLLTLPELSARTGLRLDLIREKVKSVLAPAGLAVKVGQGWIVQGKDADAVAQLLQK